VISEVVGFPEYLKTDGKIILDVTPEFAFEFSKTVTELTEFEQIKDEAVLEATLPYSKVNERVGDYLRNHNRLGNSYSPLKVLVQEGSTAHRFDILDFIGSDDEQQGFQVKLKRSADHWLSLAKRKYLYDTNMGLFEFVPSRMATNWADQASYSPNDVDAQGFYFPLVHYGGWFLPDTVIIEDFRPWFHLYFVLHQAFCEIGWKFECPFLDTDFGSRLIIYILSKEYGQNVDLLDNRKFRAAYQSPDVADFAGKVVFDDEVSDPGNNYDPTTGNFTGAGIFDFHAQLQVDAFDDPPQYIQIIRENIDGTTEIVGEQKYSYPVGPGAGSRPMNVVAENVTVYPGQKVYTALAGDSPGQLFVGVKGVFFNTPKRIYPQRGDIIQVNQLIDPELTLEDVLKGLLHLIKGKAVTDWNSKKVSVFSPYDGTVHGEPITGFFQNTRKAFADEIVVASEQVAISRLEKQRYLVLQFADSNDKKIEKLNLPEDAPLFSKKLDRGTDFDEGIEYSKNPFFAPTLNADIDKFPFIVPLIADSNIDVEAPHLWDNDQGNVSFDLKPRILYCAGLTTQRWDNGQGQAIVRNWKFEGTGRQTVPFAYQETAVVDALFATPDKKLIYGERDGSENQNDLYSIAWRGEITRLLFTVKSQLKVLLPTKEYMATTFRDLYSIYYRGRTFAARLLEIVGHKTCLDDPTVMVFRPEPFVADAECDDVVIIEPGCTDKPDIISDIDVINDIISAQANNSKITNPGNIATDQWEYSTDGGENWVPYTPGTPLPDADILFRRVVIWADACPDEVAVKRVVFETACENYPEINLEYDETTNTIVGTGAGSFNSPIATDVWQVAVDGGAAVPYTPGGPVSGFTSVVFTRVVSFTNKCPDVTAEESYTVEGDQCFNSPEIVFTEVGGAGSCIYDLSIGGTTTSTIFATEFFISRDNGTTFHKWDNKPVKGEPGLVVKGVVHYNGTCESSKISANCPNL